MGAFREYLHAASKGWENPVNAIQGNMNRLLSSVGLMSEEYQQEADRRYSICSDCPFNSKNAVRKVGGQDTSFYTTNRIEEHCSICKCPIESKVLAFNDVCGLSTLAETHTTDANGNDIMGGILGFKPLWKEFKKE